MGNEAPEASGRSEVMPAAAREEGRACACVCVRAAEMVLCKHGHAEERLGFTVWAAALLVCFLT